MGRKKRGAVRSYGKEKNFNRGGGKVGEGYDLAMRDNELFAKYYKGQGIVPEDEWEEFYATLKKTLPVTFRITGYKSQSEELLSMIKGKYFSNMLDVQVDGETIAPPKCLSWYPKELAWQLDLTRKIVRSSEPLSRLHDFLIAETECGAISRQEAVSMIPPLVMDIKSHHKILDMCASPGSKTAQLIEYMHSDCPQGELPSGYVIANDTDNKRCYLMVHQVKRLQSPCCMVVNHDGTVFPKIRTNADEHNPQFQLFDRVLCDVPCSGDGTMRKNFDVWSKWHPLQGANMHGLQLKILRRGCQILAVGGRLVYSTCSLNPAEDEAVIAEMLRSSQGAMELVDIQDMLPGLKFTKGVSSWRVMTKAGEWIESAEELPPAMKTQVKLTIFPPTPEEAEKFHLDKCIRILPHQQNTGGFFVAALQKVRHLPGSREARLEAEATAKAAEAASTAEEQAPTESEQTVKSSESVPETETAQSAAVEEAAETGGDKRKAPQSGEEPKPKKQRMYGYKEDPFLFMTAEDPVWPPIRDFFGLGEDFPASLILYRSEQGKRSLYYVSQAIRDIVRCNENRIRFINMGVKTFSRSPSPLVPECDFRITQECVATLQPHVTKRLVTVNKSDAIIITSQENPFTFKLSDDTQEQLKKMSPGSTVFMFSPSEKEPSPKCEIVFCGWRGKASVRCFGSRCDRAHALMLLGEDLKEINKRVAAEKQAKLEAKKSAEQEDSALAKEDDDDGGAEEADDVKGEEGEKDNQLKEEEAKVPEDSSEGPPEDAKEDAS